MSTTSTTHTLLNEELAQLTNESPEIRLRALEQCETCFTQNLITKEAIRFKPVQLVKQLIRWFSFTPPAVPERVLNLLLKLMRSDYGDLVVLKVPCQRFKTELGKIRQILRDLPTKRCMELLDNIQSVIDRMYNNSVESQSSRSFDMDLSVEGFNFHAEDFEAAWTRASVDDLAAMAAIADGLTVENDEQLQKELINIQIKICDYPVEYLLQTPNIFLHLLHMQQHLPQSSDTLFHINRALFVIVQLMQRSIRKRSLTIQYAKSIETGTDGSPQLRISSALGLLLTGCVNQLKMPELKHCDQNWQPIELIVEVIKTFGQLGAPIPEHLVQEICTAVAKIISYCNKNYNNAVSTINETLGDKLEKHLMIPRLQSLIFNGLLLDVIKQNILTIDRATGRALLHPLILDSTYLCCVPQRRNELCKLYGMIVEEQTSEQKQILILQEAYKLAIGQLLTETKLPALHLLEKQREISFVIVQLGSESLLQQLCEAVVKCTCMYMTRPELRNHAEMLLDTLFDLPDKALSNYALRRLKQPVVDHFHAFMNRTNYMPGCTNMQLACQHILGLPMSTKLLRKLLVKGWQSSPSQLTLQHWCIDYLIMLLGLFKLIPVKQFAVILQMVMPVVPLIVCRAINQPQLQMLLWELFEPDGQYVAPLQALLGNICYLFHPDTQRRKDAIARVTYIIIGQDPEQKYKPSKNKLSLDLLGHDLCVIKPPIEYDNIFSNRENPPPTNNMPALLRLLETPELRPAIRKSTLAQLNILMNNWHSAYTYDSCPGANLIWKKTMPDLLLSTSVDDADTLLPVVTILLRVLLRSERFRSEFKEKSAELVMFLMRCIFLLPHSQQLRGEASTCIFLLLFHEHIRAKEIGFELDVDLSAMSVPISYELNNSVPPTFAMQGLTMQKHLLAKHFDGNAELNAQYWRLFLAHCVCGSVKDLTLSAMCDLDIRGSLKLRAPELALVHATQVQRQLQHLLIEANNCCSHGALHQLVASIQLFLVYMRDDIEEAQCKALWLLVHKYLRLMPSNDADRKLYTALLQLCHSCLRYRLPYVTKGLCEALEYDPDHSFFLILHDCTVNLQLLHLVTECLVLLLSSLHNQSKSNNNYNSNTWYTKLFVELSNLATEHFELRNLQHFRCLLRVLQELSDQRLVFENDKLRSYYQQFVQLSSSLRANTHTGAQLQRDCLLIICHLTTNNSLKPADSYKIETGLKVLRYLMGLCGHSDGEVRALAWVAVSGWCKNSDGKLLSALLDMNDFLPSGLPECSLVTFLDCNEVMLVRQLAGRLFELLITQTGAEASHTLLQRHSFFEEAHLALSALHVSSNINLDADRSSAKHSCEIISCYVSICTRLIDLEPSLCATFCQHAFVHALSNVMKMPKTEMTSHKGYLDLCAQEICRFYVLCYMHNVKFMQRSICRDTVLLDGYYALMDMVLEQHMPVPQVHLIELLKMLMVFCKDEGAYKYICSKLFMQPNMLFDLLIYGLGVDFVQGTVQEYTLETLSVMLSKVPCSREDFNLLVIFEEYVDGSSDEDDDDDDTARDSAEENALEKQLKMMSLTTASKQTKPTIPKPNASVTGSPKQLLHKKTKTTGIFHLYHRMDRLFEIHYPDSKCIFLNPPTKSHVHVCEVIGNLLRLAPEANEMATKYKLIQRVHHLLETFLDDPTIGDAITYVRRTGAHKTRYIVNNLLVLLNMLINWFSAPHAVITDPTIASRFVRLLLRLWQWLAHSMVLKNMTVRLAMLLTEHSLEMCKQVSLVHSCHPQSLLQLLMRIAEVGTPKKETLPTQHGHTIIEAALRVMINCCSCIEGRLSLSKQRVLNIFDTVLSANNNMTKVKPELRLGWLTFWEIFSRYEQGSHICHLASLINAIRISPPLCLLRLRCLGILRNMCFDGINRMQLVSRYEFVDLLRDIVSQPVQDGSGAGDASLDSYKEHHLAVLCLWQLFGFNAKCRAMLRGTKLHKRLTVLFDHLEVMDHEHSEAFKKLPFASDLRDVLEMLFESIKT